MVSDVLFDVRSDTPPGKDPDSHSPRLRAMHRELWSKRLPDGRVFALSAVQRHPYLLHDSALGRFALSSDTIITSHRRRLRHLYAAVPTEENEEFHRWGTVIASRLVFPGNRVGGRQTINQARGTHARIQDRFDLTLEAIRRHYANEDSPLAETLQRYASFFAIFGSFEGYVDFFLLQDAVENGRPKFFLPFDGFRTPALPTGHDDYSAYRAAQLRFAKARTARIEAWLRNERR